MDPLTPQAYRIQVSAGDTGPYILVGREQLADVVGLLTNNGYSHNINTKASHYSVVVELGKGADVDAIQELLDNEP
jgi:hypothetical protein